MISFTASRLAGSKWSRYAIISRTPASSQAVIMRRQSASLVAIGFSHKTCAPACAARTVYSA